MYNLYIGPPGCGKTYSIKQFKKTHNNVYIIGYSWMLCSFINGKTFYNIFNISPKTKTLNDYQKKYINNLNIEYILIDEIFMFSDEEFDMIVSCINNLKNIKQVNMYGDHLQLKAYKNVFYTNFGLENIKINYLNNIYRSSGCPILKNIILDYRLTGKIKLNIFGNNIIKNYNELMQHVIMGHIICTGTNENIKTITNRIKKYSGLYKHSDGLLYSKFAMMTKPYENLFKNQIIQIKEFKESYVTASFKDTNNELKIIKIFGNKKNYNYSFPFEPLIVTTIHKLQGLTLNKIIIDYKNLFEFNSFYTAISRVKRFDDILIFINNDNRILNDTIETNANLFYSFCQKLAKSL